MADASDGEVEATSLPIGKENFAVACNHYEAILLTVPTNSTDREASSVFPQAARQLHCEMRNTATMIRIR